MRQARTASPLIRGPKCGDCEDHQSHLRLLEEDGPLRVDTTGQQAGSHVQYAAPQLQRLLRLRDGVQVYDAVHHRGVLVLQGDPVLQGAQVVAEVGHPGGLDPREHASTSWRRL